MNNPSIKPTREATVDGRAIRVFDDLISETALRDLATRLDRSSFSRTEVARQDTSQFRHWALNVADETARGFAIWEPSEQAAQLFAKPGERYRAYRSYCNYAGFGDMLFSHTDCQPNARELTALWFLVPQWDVEWGGETLFFNQHKDAEVVVSPKPGRMVMFDGAILHAGRPPSRICLASRFTFALKFERVAD